MKTALLRVWNLFLLHGSTLVSAEKEWEKINDNVIDVENEV